MKGSDLAVVAVLGVALLAGGAPRAGNISAERSVSIAGVLSPDNNLLVTALRVAAGQADLSGRDPLANLRAWQMPDGRDAWVRVLSHHMAPAQDDVKMMLAALEATEPGPLGDLVRAHLPAPGPVMVASTSSAAATSPLEAVGRRLSGAKTFEDATRIVNGLGNR